MSSLGKLGRFGNQLMQYAFLRLCAERSGAIVECPEWVGRGLFGLADPPISKQLPPAIERWSVGRNMFDALPELIRYIEQLTQLSSCRIGPEAITEGARAVDLWGFFQLHTRLLRPHQAYLRSLFRPVAGIEAALQPGLDKIRKQGRTMVGIHIRQGDFAELPLFGFTYPVPPVWWRQWLEQIWPKLDRPVLFLCSDALDRVRPVFDRFDPVTSRDLRVELPEPVRQLDFYTDFYLLTQCDVLGISNSTFSFAASLLNERGGLFVRPHWDFSTRFIEFDPWDSEQLLYYGGRGKLFKSFREAMRVAWNTEGTRGALRCAAIYPRERVKMKINRAKYAYQGGGLRTVLPTLFRRLPTALGSIQRTDP